MWLGRIQQQVSLQKLQHQLLQQCMLPGQLSVHGLLLADTLSSKPRSLTCNRQQQINQVLQDKKQQGRRQWEGPQQEQRLLGLPPSQPLKACRLALRLQQLRSSLQETYLDRAELLLLPLQGMHHPQRLSSINRPQRLLLPLLPLTPHRRCQSS